MKVFFLLILIGLFAYNGLSQNTSERDSLFEKNTNRISLYLQHSLRIPNNTVEITMTRNRLGIFLHIQLNPLRGHPEWDYTHLDTTYKIEEEKFTKVLRAVRKFSGIDLEYTNGLIGNDGTSCQLTFGGFQNYVTYTVWSPNYDTKRRKTGAFLEACIEIIKAAKLNPKKILD